MGLTEQLAKEKDAIVKRWFERVVDTYPAETSRFLRSQKDPFANPVGQTTFQGLATLVDLLSGPMDPEKARNALDPIIRIRAIQDFTASRAVRFVFELKAIVRATAGQGQDLTELEARIDELALVAFDLYMACREKIYDLKANEMKSRTYKAFAKAGLIKELDDE